MCTKDGRELFGKVVGMTALGHPPPSVALTSLGECVDETIRIASKGHVIIDKYVVMPNHVHMIIVLGNRTDDRERISLQQIVRNIKSYVTKWAGMPVWQSRFYDHVIRDEEEHRKIWQYIDENPAKWAEDRYYVDGN